MPSQFQGAITALITPMYEDGRVHWGDLRRLVEFQAANGINGVLSGGTTGQSPTLHEEQREINQTVIKIAGDKNPVVVGTGTYDTSLSEELTVQAWLDGADATLHVMGYYNRPSQLGVIDYFDRIARAAPIPVIMYNIPPRGAAEYKPETMIYLAKRHPNIIGVKEASGNPAVDVAKITKELAVKHGLPQFRIISGDDDKTYALMSDKAISGDGVISVMSNLLPATYVRFTGLLLESKKAEAEELNQVLSPLNGMVGLPDTYTIEIDDVKYEITNDTFRNPAPVQAAAYILGMVESPMLRSPLVPLGRNAVENVGRRLAQVYRDAPDFFDPIKQFFRVDVARRLESYRIG